MIGVFDSGVGGLYTLAALRRLLPDADLCYYADEENLPYGGRTAAELLRLSSRALRFLAAKGADAILLACGTVSSLVLPRLARDFPLPLYGALVPAAEGATALLTGIRAPRVLLLATAGTVRAGALAGEILARRPGAVVSALPCPDFVPLAEALAGGACNEGEATRTIARLLSPVRGRHFDAVVLGCTHFSALKNPIRRVLGGVAVADAATLTAEAAARDIKEGLCGTGGALTLYTSGDPLPFARAARAVLGVQAPVLQAT